MLASHLVEIAATATRLHRALLEEPRCADYWRADQFWILSRARVIEWSRHLKSCHSIRTQDEGFDPVEFWETTRPVIEEVFLAEIGTRIWCATLSIVDERWLHGELDPISRSVFIASLEVRRRALRLLLFARGLPGIATTGLNILRRDCELWTDSLLARLSSQETARQFGFERQRIRQLHRANGRIRSARIAAQCFDHELVGMKYAVAVRPSLAPVCGELNGEIAATILDCLPMSGFDACGVPRAGWSVDGFHADLLSVDLLEDLCGNSPVQRYDVRGGLLDRR